MYKAVNAWYLIILVRFFEEIPEELLEAAGSTAPIRSRPSGWWCCRWPSPRIATIALFYLVFHWNEFFRPLLYLNDQNKWPLQVVLRQFVVEGDKLAIVGLEDMGKYTNASQIDLRALQGRDDPADHRADPADLPADPEVLHQGHDDGGAEGMSAPVARPLQRQLEPTNNQQA